MSSNCKTLSVVPLRKFEIISKVSTFTTVTKRNNVQNRAKKLDRGEVGAIEEAIYRSYRIITKKTSNI